MKKWILAVMATCAVLVAGLSASYLAQAGTDTKIVRLNALEAELTREEAKLNAMVVPRLEDVGREAYIKAAEENAAQGLKVKELQIKAMKLQRELAGSNPAVTKEQVEGRLNAAWAAFLDAQAEYRRDPTSADAAKYLPIIERKLAALERVESDYIEGKRPLGVIYQELLDLANPE